MPKKRITLRVNQDEVAIVGPIDRWQHLILTYEFLATIYPESENAWLEAAAWIRDGITNAKKPFIHDEGCGYRCSEPCTC